MFKFFIRSISLIVLLYLTGCVNGPNSYQTTARGVGEQRFNFMVGEAAGTNNSVYLRTGYGLTKYNSIGGEFEVGQSYMGGAWYKYSLLDQENSYVALAADANLGLVKVDGLHDVYNPKEIYWGESKKPYATGLDRLRGKLYYGGLGLILSKQIYSLEPFLTARLEGMSGKLRSKDTSFETGYFSLSIRPVLGGTYWYNDNFGLTLAGELPITVVALPTIISGMPFHMNLSLGLQANY